MPARGSGWHARDWPCESYAWPVAGRRLLCRIIIHQIISLGVHMPQEQLLVIAVGGSVVAVAALASSRQRNARTKWRDPRRNFTQAERQEIFARAGWRCEHVGWLFRCRRPAQHADHLWPWVAGGPTSVTNGQALCARHNLSKGSKLPGRLYMARLQRTRSRRHRS